MKPPVLILQAPGTNRERDTAEAFDLAGAAVDIVPTAVLRESPHLLRDYRLICVPGGFSYGDALGAGRLLGLELERIFGDMLREHLARGRPILGICNGFQALLRSGLIAGRPSPVTLTQNHSGHFECRWVTIIPAHTSSPWLSSLGPMHLPVAHAEGRLAGDIEVLRRHAALRYVPTPETPDGYPGNPNGSPDDIAALTDETGLVLGLMPHPEDSIRPLVTQASLRMRGSGLALFRAGVALAASV